MMKLLQVMTGAVIGAILGSFLATLVIRWSTTQSAVTGRSRCDHCGIQLSARELIPVASYVLQGRRTRCCGQPIDSMHPAAEALSALIGVVSFGMLGWDGWQSALFGWLLLALVLFDLRYFILPDWLNALLLVVGLVIPMPEAIASLTDRLIGVVAGYAVLASIAVLYRKIRHREGLGGGDAKLLAAVGAWVGWQSLPLIVIFAGMLGLAAAFALKLMGRDVAATTRLPLGMLIAGAAWPVWMCHQIML